MKWGRGVVHLCLWHVTRTIVAFQLVVLMTFPKKQLEMSTPLPTTSNGISQNYTARIMLDSSSYHWLLSLFSFVLYSLDLCTYLQWACLWQWVTSDHALKNLRCNDSMPRSMDNLYQYLNLVIIISCCVLPTTFTIPNVVR